MTASLRLDPTGPDTWASCRALLAIGPLLPAPRLVELSARGQGVTVTLWRYDQLQAWADALRAVRVMSERRPEDHNGVKAVRERTVYAGFLDGVEIHLVCVEPARDRAMR